MSDSSILSRPAVSVIMNCYNGQKYLRNAIDSVLAQTYQDWEIIFWDNQSTDNSAEIFKSYQDARLKYCYAPTHTRLYDARNHAIKQASGDYLAFLDVDDWWLPEKLAVQIPRFADAEVGMVCGNYIAVSERQNRSWVEFKEPLPTGWVLNDLLKRYFVGMLTLVVRRTALESLAYPCDPRYHINGDFDLVVRLSIGWKLDCVQTPVACYRLHWENETEKNLGLVVRERKLWLSEAARVPAVSSTEGFVDMTAAVAFREGMNELMRGRRLAASRIAWRMPRRKSKLKLFVALILPRWLWSIRHSGPVGQDISDLGV